MENTVLYWETDSLALHLIENDLKHARLVKKCNDQLIKTANHSSLYESVLWLVGIYESEYQKKLYRIYNRERNLSDDPSVSVTMCAEELYVHLKGNLFVQKLKISQSTSDNKGVERLIMNLIKNDLIFFKLYNSIDPILRNYKYESTLFKPLLWILGQWDVKSIQDTRSFYFNLRKEVNEITIGRESEELDILTLRIYTQLKSRIKDSFPQVK